MIIYLVSKARYDMACPSPIDPWKPICAFKNEVDVKKYIKDQCTEVHNKGFAGWRSNEGIFGQEIRTYYKASPMIVYEKALGEGDK